ncbi:hypothetical protein Tco_1304436 [Tanacetum coccineum]
MGPELTMDYTKSDLNQPRLPLSRSFYTSFLDDVLDFRVNPPFDVGLKVRNHLLEGFSSTSQKSKKITFIKGVSVGDEVETIVS